MDVNSAAIDHFSTRRESLVDQPQGLANSLNLQMPFANRRCSGELQSGVRMLGLQTRIARHLARLVATFIRLRL